MVMTNRIPEVAGRPCGTMLQMWSVREFRAGAGSGCNKPFASLVCLGEMCFYCLKGVLREMKIM